MAITDGNSFHPEPDALKKEVSHDENQDKDGDHQIYGNGDQGTGTNGWNQPHGDDYGDTSAEHDPHVTGIKEDG